MGKTIALFSIFRINDSIDEFFIILENYPSIMDIGIAH